MFRYMNIACIIWNICWGTRAKSCVFHKVVLWVWKLGTTGIQYMLEQSQTNSMEQ
jgi:hypothetical protein